MVILPGACLPRGSHPPANWHILEFPFGADKKIPDVDCGHGALAYEKPLNASYNFLDVRITLSRLPMLSGERHLENRDYNPLVVRVVIDREGFEEWVVARDWDVLLVTGGGTYLGTAW